MIALSTIATAQTTYTGLNKIKILDENSFKNKTEYEKEMSDLIDQKKFKQITLTAEKLLKENKLNYDGRTMHTMFMDTYLHVAKIPRVTSVNYFIDNINEAEGWIKSEPKSAVAYIYKAFWVRSYAWYIRGGQYTSNTADSKMQFFADTSIKNLNFLFENYEEASKDPFYYYILLETLCDLGLEEQALHAYKDGILKYPDYRMIYNTYISQFSPKWFGENYDAIKMIIDDIQKSNPSLKDIYYYHIMYTVNNNNYDLNRLDIDWDRVDQGSVKAIMRMPTKSMLSDVGKLYCNYNKKNRYEKILKAIPTMQLDQNFINEKLLNCKKIEDRTH